MTDTAYLRIVEFYCIALVIIGNAVAGEVYIVGRKQACQQERVGIGRHFLAGVIPVLAVVVANGSVVGIADIMIIAYQSGSSIACILLHGERSFFLPEVVH